MREEDKIKIRMDKINSNPRYNPPKLICRSCLKEFDGQLEATKHTMKTSHHIFAIGKSKNLLSIG